MRGAPIDGRDPQCPTQSEFEHTAHVLCILLTHNLSAAMSNEEAVGHLRLCVEESDLVDYCDMLRALLVKYTETKDGRPKEVPESRQASFLARGKRFSQKHYDLLAESAVTFCNSESPHCLALKKSLSEACVQDYQFRCPNVGGMVYFTGLPRSMMKSARISWQKASTRF